MANQTSHKATVTVVASAYNEEASMTAFLASVLQQKEKNFFLEKIIISSDGSTDQTVRRVRQYHDPRIEVHVHTTRRGKAVRMNELYATAGSEIIVQTDADVLFGHPEVIAHVIAPLLDNSRIGLASGRQQPLPGTTFTERAVNATFDAYAPLRRGLRGGHTIFSADGKLLAIRTALAQTVRIPSDAIGIDHFLYFSCLQKNWLFRHVPTAVVYYRSPRTLRDQLTQQLRFASVSWRMQRYFDAALVEREYAIPVFLRWRGMLKEFFHHPVLCGYIILVNSYCRRKARRLHSRLNGLWEIARSTKMLNNHEQR